MNDGNASEAAEPAHLPAAFLEAIVRVQCLRCAAAGRNTILEVGLQNSDPADLDHVDETEVSCPSCSAELNENVVISIAVLAGQQAQDVFAEGLNDDDERARVEQELAGGNG